VTFSHFQWLWFELVTIFKPTLLASKNATRWKVHTAMNSSNSVIAVWIPATVFYLYLHFDVMSSFVFRVDTGFPKGQFPVQEIMPKVYEV